MGITDTIENHPDLPEQWRTALERDRLGFFPGADPAPERRAARMLAAFIATGLFFLALPGTLLGVWNLLSIAEHQAGDAAHAAWVQAHGHALLFGWVGTFILGISLYVVPKFMGRPMTSFGLAWTAWGLWTAGAAWRWWAGFGAEQWRAGLAGAALLQLLAFAAALCALGFARKQPEMARARKWLPVGLGSGLGAVGFLSLGLALVMNLVLSMDAARNLPAPVFPPQSNQAFLLIALWGFAVPVALGYSTRFVTIFLSLQPPARAMAGWLTAAVIALVASALLHQFLLADLFALLLALAAVRALRVFRPSVREPKRIAVYRHYDAFVRLSFAWLVLGAVLGVLARLFPALTGLGGASRHAVTVGFLATLIFSIGPRMLPSFLNSRQLWSTRLMAATLWFVSLGCLLRVSSESAAYSTASAAWHVLPVSALLELAGVFLFVGNMAMTLSQPIPAWFGPAGIAPHHPLYFYVSSFPKTMQVLVEAGLETLGRVRYIPRSLTLQQAADADGVDMEKLQSALRAFFERRQPRQQRVGGFR